ncbi:hypothetical protein MKW98_019237 [Papaver atlanticum]|uniref:Uncharacterized protein n=1 Tax=Papaver atlanticum TaxID=357466 RepID=A0AAD4TDB6_9MAGN|nr:hypothetical protein MKW98_019237 [Papaver atlanticum]
MGIKGLTLEECKNYTLPVSTSMVVFSEQYKEEIVHSISKFDEKVQLDRNFATSFVVLCFTSHASLLLI